MITRAFENQVFIGRKALRPCTVFLKVQIYTDIPQEEQGAPKPGTCHKKNSWIKSINWWTYSFTEKRNTNFGFWFVRWNIIELDTDLLFSWGNGQVSRSNANQMDYNNEFLAYFGIIFSWAFVVWVGRSKHMCIFIHEGASWMNRD